MVKPELTDQAEEDKLTPDDLRKRGFPDPREQEQQNLYWWWAQDADSQFIAEQERLNDDL